MKYPFLFLCLFCFSLPIFSQATWVKFLKTDFNQPNLVSSANLRTDLDPSFSAYVHLSEKLEEKFPYISEAKSGLGIFKKCVCDEKQDSVATTFYEVKVMIEVLLVAHGDYLEVIDIIPYLPAGQVNYVDCNGIARPYGYVRQNFTSMPLEFIDEILGLDWREKIVSGFN